MPNPPAIWQLIAQGSRPRQPALLIIHHGQIVTVGRSPQADITLPSHSLSRLHAELEIIGDRLRVKDLSSTNGTLLNGTRITEANAKPGDTLCLQPFTFMVQSLSDAATLLPHHPASRLTEQASVMVPSTSAQPAEASRWISRGAKQAMQYTSSHSGQSPAFDARQLAGEDKNGRPTTHNPQATQIAIILRGSLCGQSDPVRGKVFDLNRDVLSIGRDTYNQISIEHTSVSAKHARLSSVDGQWLLEDLGSTNGTFINGEKISSRIIRSKDDISFGHVEFKFLINPHDALEQHQTAPDRSRPQLFLQLGIFAVLVVILVFSIPQSWKGIFDELRYSLKDTALGLNRPAALDTVTLEKLYPTIHLPDNSLLSSVVLFDINQDKYADVVTVSQQGLLQAFSGASGEAIGQRQLPLPVIAPGTVAADSKQASLVIIHPQTTIRLVGSEFKDTAIIKQPKLQSMKFQSLLLDVNDDGEDDLLITDHAAGVSALDGKRIGWTLWRTSAYLEGKMTAPPLLVRFDRSGSWHIYSGSDSGQAQAFTLEGGRLNLLWSQAIRPIVFASPVLAGDSETPLIAFLENQDTLLALNANSGILQWRYELAALSFTSPVSIDCNQDGALDVIALSANGAVVAIDGRNGGKLWQTELSGEIYAPPAIFDANLDRIDDLVVLDDSGRLAVINGADGAELVGMNFSQDMKFQLSPLVGDINNDGFIDIVVTGQNNTIHSYRTNIPIKIATQVWPAHGGRQEQYLFSNDHD
jgi:pSer/pThr/pTyr-binding forkhead associated (FHA) protein/outer membrane protein assembly factor BamB